MNSCSRGCIPTTLSAPELWVRVPESVAWSFSSERFAKLVSVLPLRPGCLWTNAAKAAEECAAW